LARNELRGVSVEHANRKNKRVENLHDMEAGLDHYQAMIEASRCLVCQDPPCSPDCPADTDPGTFLRKFKLRNVKGAIRTIKSNNVLGGICGTLCPTEMLCMKGCSASGIDRPIEIGRVQRFLVEHGWETGFKPIERKEPRQGRVAVIGSGPSGLTCAAELAKNGYDVTIFEGRARAGGVLRYGVPEFRMNPEFLDRELKDVLDLGVELKTNSRIERGGADRLLSEGFDAVFMGPGAWSPVRLDIPGGGLRNVTNSEEFLEGMRSGAAGELGSQIRGRNVAIVGGGSVAMDVATTCTALGANKVYVIYRRSLREMPADEDDLEMALANNITLRTQSVVTELLGEDGRLVALKGIETDWKSGGDRSAGNLIPVPGTEYRLRVDLFIWAIGMRPENSNTGLSKEVEHMPNGLIKTGEDGVSTTHPRIFVGGDASRGPALIVQAVRDGKTSAGKIMKMLQELDTEGGE